MLDGGTLGRAMGFLSKCPPAQSVMITPRVKRSDVLPEPFALNDLTTFDIPRELSMVFQHIARTPRLEELYLFPLNDVGVPPHLSDLQLLPLQSLKRVTLIRTMLSRCSGELYDFIALHPGTYALPMLRPNRHLRTSGVRR
jgi:hypothetical protein